jgi:cytochrome c oxidase cbb3-type subunit III
MSGFGVGMVPNRMKPVAWPYWLKFATRFRRLLVVAACAAGLSYTQEKAAPANISRFAPSEGERTFAEHCAGCHGLDGHGGRRAPDITARRDVQKLSDAELRQIIREGVAGTGMPPFRSLGPTKIEALVQHLRTLQGEGSNATLPGSPEAGRELFFGKAGCSECHMVNGAGGFMGSDLSGSGRTKSADQIREEITDFRKHLDQHGNTVVVTTLGGQTFTGIARNEDNFSLQLQTRDGVFHFFDKSNLQKIEHQADSLMPKDYGSRLAGKEINDIVSYLMSVGRRVQPDSQVQGTSAHRNSRGHQH